MESALKKEVFGKVVATNEVVNVGFDVGIASVGWSVVSNTTGTVLETGVSIFPSGTAAKNRDRRTFRQSRRLLRRKKNRISDMRLFLKNNGFEHASENNAENPYIYRVKGLSEKLEREELAIALLHLVKRRGISYSLKDLDEEENGSESNYQESIGVNQKLLKKMTPAEIQLERLNKYGKVRGQVKDLSVVDSPILLNVFPNSAYVEELKKILEIGRASCRERV